MGLVEQAGEYAGHTRALFPSCQIPRIILHHLLQLLLLLLLPNLIQSCAAGACPSSRGSGKRVFCYYEGKRPPSEVDPCPCTHLLYKNVHIDHNSRLRFTDRMSHII